MSKSSRVGLLLSCVGRRVELIRAFRDAAKQSRISLEVHGADASRLSPAMQFVDRAHAVPLIKSGDYVAALKRIVRREHIGLLIPLLDWELPLIAGAREDFASIGCRAVISSEAVVRTCRDKLATFRALRGAGIDTPDTWTLREVLSRKKHHFPYFLKPRFGSAAKGNYLVRDRDELHVLARRVSEPIVQEFVNGVEFTLDVYTGFDGRPRCVVPRKRLEVRTGEVSKGIIVKDAAIMEVGRRVADMLGEGRGVITVQCMLTSKRQIRVIEINPRFGGGAPLSIRAGADFPKWILLQHLGRRVVIRPHAFTHDLAMLRFDESVFVRNASRYVSDR